MPHIELLAHRGWWDKPEQRNSPAAINRAFNAGLGIETDLRDCNSDIVIAHDPTKVGTSYYKFRDLLHDFKDAGQPGTLALNIKADGLQPAVSALLTEFKITRYFLFDMSIPDTLQWVKVPCPVYTRQSEYEPVAPLYDQAAGIWIDCFKHDWFEQDIIQAHLIAGKKVAVVSPELHGRDPAAVWSLLHTFQDPRISLCTDRIPQARSFFHGQD